ncbi:hypothetical protein J6590_052363, partial [Homalodisca vitripennis]
MTRGTMKSLPPPGPLVCSAAIVRAQGEGAVAVLHNLTWDCHINQPKCHLCLIGAGQRRMRSHTRAHTRAHRKALIFLTDIRHNQWCLVQSAGLASSGFLCSMPATIWLL